MMMMVMRCVVVWCGEVHTTIRGCRCVQDFSSRTRLQMNSFPINLQNTPTISDIQPVKFGKRSGLFYKGSALDRIRFAVCVLSTNFPISPWPLSTNTVAAEKRKREYLRELGLVRCSFCMHGHQQLSTPSVLLAFVGVDSFLSLCLLPTMTHRLYRRRTKN